LFLSVGILNMHNAKIGYSVKSEYKNNIDIMNKLKNIETDIPVFWFQTLGMQMLLKTKFAQHGRNSFGVFFFYQYPADGQTQRLEEKPRAGLRVACYSVVRRR